MKNSSRNPGDLGEVVGTFKPGPANVIAGLIIALLLLGGGCVLLFFVGREILATGGKMPFHADKGMSWLSAGLMSVIAIVLMVCSYFLAGFVRSLYARRVDLCANGFCDLQGSKEDHVAWAEIAAVKEVILYERPPVLKGPAKLLLPKVASYSYLVVTNDGNSFSFDGNSIKGIRRFGKELRERSESQGVKWETVETHA